MKAGRLDTPMGIYTRVPACDRLFRTRTKPLAGDGRIPDGARELPGSGVGEANGEGGIQVVPGVGAKRDVRLGRGDALHLVEPAGDDVG